MKTRAMDKATGADSENDSLYPFATTLVESGYPSTRQFEVVRDKNGETVGIKSRVDFDNRTLVARVFGYALNDCRPHTFQISARIRLYDPWFCGQLHHSCEPNLYFDTAYLQLWTIKSIAANTWLTIDFAKTGDVLPQQFACQCGCSICRGWIKGPEEQLSPDGYLFFNQLDCLSRP